MQQTLSFHQEGADTWVNPTFSLNEAMCQTTHLAIGAHQDDLEIMAYEGIASCYQSDEHWFAGVVVTDGRGSSRTGPYASYTDEQMRDVRRKEQRNAAQIGRYSAQFQLDYTSKQVKHVEPQWVKDDLVNILEACKPETVYLHQPADKHDSHITTLTHCIEALRENAENHLPNRIIGCEVWRDLDWLSDQEKIPMDCSKYPDLAKKLLLVFDSQIVGGKRYDAAALGRRIANATFYNSHQSDTANAISWGMDLKPLVINPDLSIEDFILAKLNAFSADVIERINRFKV